VAVAFRVNVKGLEQTRAYFKRLGKQIPASAVPDGLVELGLWIQSNAAREQIIRGGPKGAPPDARQLTSRTGTLRRSIRVDRQGLPKVVSVGSDLEYARPHELGSPKQNLPARPYLTPAAAEAERRGLPESIMNKHIRRAISGSAT